MSVLLHVQEGQEEGHSCLVLGERMKGSLESVVVLFWVIGVVKGGRG
jgi:hypothetical protein